MDYINLRPEREINENGMVFELGSLYEYFTKVADPRDKRGKQYALPILLTLLVLAKLGDEDRPSGISDWVMLRKELLMEHFQREFMKRKNLGTPNVCQLSSMDTLN
jgi:hypothetical protein